MDPKLVLATAICAGCVLTWTTTSAADAGADRDDIADPCEESAGEQRDLTLLPSEDEEEVVVKFDRARLDAAGRNVIEGNVNIRMGGAHISTEKAEYNTKEGTVLFPGALTATTLFISLNGSKGRSDLDSQNLSVEDVEFSRLAQDWRGSASKLLASQTGVRVENLSISTCPVGSTTWRIDAREITADSARNHISVKGAIIRLSGIPVLYLPWFRIPSGFGSTSSDSNRTSGILLPSIESDSSRGTKIYVPVYLNLAANYDLTLTPRVETERGLGAGAEFRILLAGSPLSVELEALRKTFAEEDPESEILNRDPDDSSLWSIEASHEAFAPRWSSWLRYEDTTFPPSYSDSSWTSSVMAFRFQHKALEIGVRIQRPAPLAEGLVAYSTIPTIEAQWSKRYWLGEIRQSGSFTSFHASDEGLPVSVTSGMRAHLDSTYYRPFQVGPLNLYGGTTTHLTGYSIARSRSEKKLAEGRSAQSTFAGAKLRALRSFRLGDVSFRQNLDFRVQYVTRWITEYEYILVSQADLAQFDNGWRTYNFDMLFDVWQVNGRDRLPEREDVAIGVETQLLRMDDGFEFLSASLGVLHQFQANSVQVGPGIAAIQRPKTRAVASIEFAPTGRLSARIGGSWPRGASEPEQSHLSAVYKSKGGMVLHADAVKYLRANLSAYDFGTFIPVTKKWAVFARNRHDQQHDRNLDTFLGIQYQNCCVTVRVLAREYVRPSLSAGFTDLDQKTSILLQIGLKGLGTLGSGLESVLFEGIPELSGVDENEWIGDPILAW